MKNKVHSRSLSLLFLFTLSLVIKPPVVQGCNQIRCGHKKPIVITTGMVVGGIRSGCGHDTIIVEPGAQVVSEGPDAIGIDSGNGHDSVINGGTITVIATAVQDAGEKGYGSGYACGSYWKKTIPDASATAIGIQTGNGRDTVLNTGTIAVNASSLLTDSGTARSLAIGIDSGNGKDSSENLDSGIVSETPPDGAAGTALIEVAATSSASLSGNSWEFTGKHKVDLSVNTEATAIGIVGGNGKDSINNASTLNVSAVSDITAEGTSATLLGVGGVNMSIHGDAFAIGIDGGNGKDEIINQGDITVSATSDIETESITASVLGAAQINDSDFDGSTTATAEAVGIYTGMAKDEVLGISNSSTIDVQAEASVDAESYALTFAGDAITDLSLAATAVASGIGSGCGKDTIANAGTLTVGASSSVESVSLELNFLDILKSKADLDAEAEAVGIASGSGKDSVLNTGTITVNAEASTEAWTGEFNAIDVAIGDFSSYSSAEAIGIASGCGKDTITNTGTISADATADALVGNFTLTMIDFTAIPDLLDTVGNASTTVDAAAVGISSGTQDDTIISSGDITATATTEATTITVGVGAEGIPAGVPEGDILSFENLASAGVLVDSQATGIDSGTGDDEIINQGNITADASATSWGGSVSLSLPLLEKWVPIPSPAFAMISAGTEVGSVATGIQAGEGDDLIVNEGDLDIDAASSALNVTASLAFQGFVSDINIADIAAARADAYTKAEATASGIEGGEGDDQIFNSGDITVDATSETLSVAAAIAIQKSVKEAVNLEGTMADISATATAEATGISGGSGHDTITSTGNTTVTAESNNAGVGLSAAVTCEAEKGLVANAAVAKADTTATAKATGIDGGEGEDTIFNSGTVDVTANAGALSAEVGLTVQGSNTKVLSLQGALTTVTTTVDATAEGLSGGSENDTIINEGDLTVEADSLGIAAAIAANITPKKTKGIGIAVANAQNTVTATATGISGGEGDDTISNSGDVTVGASSTAVAASVTVTRVGFTGSGTLDPASFDSGNNAEAIATGIDGGEGNEIITNSGALAVSSTVVTPSVGVAASSKGISTAITTATATSEATGIDTGEGTHWIHNTGSISADAEATAVGVSVAVEGKGVAASIDTVWDGGTTATATAMGIHAESGDDIITNEGAIDATSSAVAPSVDVAITNKGISVGISTATSEALSVGIDSGEGDDQIYNSGAITASASAEAYAIAVDIAGKGAAVSANDVWDGGVEATATAKGIDAGAGSNTLVNEGDITADSSASTVSAAVSIVGKGFAASVSTATATAEAVGIDPGETTQNVYNSGDITAQATATAVTVNVDITGKGAAVAADAVWDGGTTATATARGIDAGHVDNTIWNEGTITVDSEATAPSVGVAIAGKGLTAAVTTSTAVADSVGIDTREGDDIVHNSGAIEADATAEAYAIEVAVAGKGVAVAANTVWDGGTKATATATGIDTGNGNDTIFNTASIQADSSATTVSVGVAVAGKGISAAVSTSTAEAQAFGIATGEGSDTIQSTGDIAADAASTAVTVNVDITGKGVAVAADAVWDGGTKSTAVAKGIDAGSGNYDDTILSTGNITATSEATTVSVSAAIAAKGITAATSTATTTASSTGIDTGAGADIIQSEGAIVADASATGVAVAASITAKGIAAAFDEVWDGGTDTTTTAKGIDAGDGDDSIISTGDITATSDATTVAVAAAITAKGISAATTTATTTATAVGIDSGAGSDLIQSEGAITADASATGVAVAASITAKGIAAAFDEVWDGGTDTTTIAKGIDAGVGDDSIISTGDITATSDALTVAVDAAITAKGISAASSTATTTATAVGIDAGAGNDTIQSEGTIVTDASATGVAVAASITAKGISVATDAVWDGGTETTTVAKGINAADGDDSIISTGDITATSDATTVAVDAAITAMGITAASSTATTTATAVGIDSGAGSDVIQSEGAITADASATGVAVAASIAAKGIAAAFDEVWDGGTNTTTVAMGIDSADGDDSIISIGDITATSDATTVAVDAAITAMGISAAATTATTTATAAGIDSGAGNDTIQSEGAITADASATGIAVAASITAKGIAVATDAVWDGGTDTIATAMGINAADGDDSIISTGDITATSEALTVAVDAAITAMGVSGAATTATTTSTAVGIDSGAGSDIIQSEGAIIADSSATGVAVAASVTAMGIAGSMDAVWDGGTDTTATAVGIDGGAGNDLIENDGAITATADATTVAVDVAIAAKGIAAAATASTTTANTVGIDSGAGNDTIITTGNITADSSAFGVGVAAGITGFGISGATDAVWDSGTTATSVAKGIEAGAGDDTIDNSGAISVTSQAETIAVDAAITGIGITAAMTNTTVRAEATGIAGGDGADFIHNDGNISGDASATAIGVGVSVSGAGISLSGSDLWDNGVSGQSVFTGIDGGAGNDTIDNSGTITGHSEATTPAISVSLTLAGIGGAATTSTADSRAYGIDGGDGDDLITNTGAIALSSIADANTVNVSAAGVGIAVTADKVWDGGTTATATTTGIAGGEGNDTINNSAAIAVFSEADTGSVGVSASLAGITGTVATSTAMSTATGIDGGTENDSIINTGNIAATAVADANTVIVSISGIGISAGADSFWDGGTTATATATGIAGGGGNDAIDNTAAITTSATADTGSTGVTATLAGASASLVNSTAKAQAAGIDGGEGDDSISNTGAITATAKADADTVGVSVAGIGASFAGDQWSENTLASATAIGIAGGGGNDTITNSGDIEANATSDTDATTVAVTLVGYNDAEAETTSEATATGIAGGDGHDTITNTGNITLTSTSTADANSVSVTLAGAAPAEAGTTAMAVGIGIDGGTGDDTIHNEGNLSITSTATTDASSVSVQLVGYGDAEVDNQSLAMATGIAGGDGNDNINNTGNITLASTSTAEAGSVSVGLAGAVFGDAGTAAAAVTVGLDGGAGSDLIENRGSITATSTASTDSSSTGVVVAGYLDSKAECASLAAATGISGEAGDDTIINYDTGSISLVSLATADAGSVKVGIAGAATGETGTTAVATATAIDGGIGSDTIENAAQINVAAVTATTADNTTVQIFGSGQADVDTTAVTIARGIESGAGDDSIENTGNISVSSSSAMTLDGYSFTFGGASSGQGELMAFSSSVGISGGSDSDTINNEGQISVSALATMSVTGGSDVAFGSASASANTTAVTDAVGIDAGDGDDTITNQNTITVSAVTAMALDSSSFSFGGTAASGEGAMSAITGAVGISGGEGSDSITNDALITVTPRTAMYALSGSDVAFGSAEAGTSITARTEAVGIDGGSGNDTIINKGGITVGYYNDNPADAMTKIDISGSTWSFGGTGSVSAAAQATTNSIGIDAGSGDDLILNEANMEVNSTSYAKTYGSGYTFAGTSGSTGVVTANSSAVGISGGTGNDSIRNSAVLTVRARSCTTSTGSVSATFGSSEAYAGATSIAAAVGIDGGAGDETIENTGTISVGAYAHAYGSTDSDVFAGSPSADSETTAVAAAAGIDAGTGNHSIDNQGLIIANASAGAAPDATADSDISDNEADAVSRMNAAAVGISAQDGDDEISNSESGSIIVSATTVATPYAHSDEDSTATGVAYAATAKGIEAGDGNNTISNLGSIQVKAQATIIATAVSRSLVYTARSNAAATATVEAAGITTGVGDDVIANGKDAAIRVKAEATATALGTPRPGEGAHTDVGNATVGLSWFPLTATASGISAGDGDNTIDNLGVIDAEARTQATAKGEADTDFYSNTATANVVASTIASGISSGIGTDGVLNDVDASIRARATTVVVAVADPDEVGYIGVSAASAAYGIKLGNGDKDVINRGSVTAIAESTSAANSSAESDLWDTDTGIVATISATARGIATGKGDSHITNSGDIEARAVAGSSAYSYSDSIDDALSQVNTVVQADARGITAGGGGTVTVENSGSVKVSASSYNTWYARADSGGVGFGEVNYYVTSPSVSSTAAYGISVGDAVSTSIHNNAQAEIKVDVTAYLYAAANGDEKSIIGRSGAARGAEVIARAAGISLGNGDNQVQNDGSISVNLDADGDVKTRSYSGNRSTHTYSCVKTEGSANGISTGNGENLIANNGDIIVKANGEALANMTDSNFTDIQSDSGADALALADALAIVSASGIRTGSGINTIVNSDLINVQADTYAYSATYADDMGAAYDDYATSYSYARSYAYGILAGPDDSTQGSNEIHNKGTITVQSSAGAAAYAYARDFGWFDDSGYAHREAHASASSYGILTGNGNNWITNEGTIYVSAVASGDVGRTFAQAYGIKTGSGNDIIENFGSITTIEVENGFVTKGTGIDAGSGSDTVVLHDGSYIGCELNLGEGNDGLTVIGTGTISGNVYGGDGTDALTLDGATNFDLDKTFDFESLAKLGSSIVSLNNAQMLESLDVFEGILQINNNYQFTDTGSFSTKVYGGGACGQLLVNGNLGLDGTMTVVRGPGAYLDGTNYEVMTADTLSGAFDNIVLPNSTPLLGFDIANKGSNGYLVTASTENFATVATNKVEQTITKHLDSIIASTEGDLSLVLGEIQGMPASGYATAFSSLSPDSYDCSTKTTFSAADQFTQVLSNRLKSLRLSSTVRPGDSGVRPLIDRTAFGTASGQSTSSEQTESYGLWFSGFGQWGGFDPGDGYTGFDFNLYGTTLGYDHYLGRKLTAGVSLGYSNTDVYFDYNRGAGLINTVTGSVYGGYSTEHLFVDTALSYGRQSYENYRNVEVGSLQRSAESEHGGNAFLAYLGGGFNFGISPWTVEPLASMQYMYLGEEAFTEEGAGSVSLNVHERTTNSLVSDLGLRLGLSFNTGRGDLISELYTAWRHDFAVDEGTITASFVDTPDAPFTISGPEVQQNGVLLGASLIFKDSDRFSAALKYNIELRGQYSANSLIGEIHYGF